MDTQHKPTRLIGPEDVKVGHYVTIAHESVECFKLNCSVPGQDTIDVLHVEMRYCGAGWPMKVLAVSQPYVLVTDPRGRSFNLDLRRYRLARLPKRFGATAFEKIAASPTA
ncbi:MAG: hypothetical protein GC162_02665 [Planctomycetes bacterium]|nr:hypothetical protein [Planctomycetota bacterium]